MEQFTQPVEGQHHKQEAAAAHGDLYIATLVHTRKSISYSVRGRVPVAEKNTTHPSGRTMFFSYPGLVIGPTILRNCEVGGNSLSFVSC